MSASLSRDGYTLPYFPLHRPDTLNSINPKPETVHPTRVPGSVDFHATSGGKRDSSTPSPLCTFHLGFGG